MVSWHCSFQLSVKPVVEGLLDIDHCHPNLLMYKLLTRTADENESGFVSKIGKRDSQLKGDHAAADRGHMYMMVKMSDLFGFVND